MNGDLSDFEEKKKFLKRVHQQKRPPPQKKKNKNKLLKNFLKKLVRIFANKLGTELNHASLNTIEGRIF